MLHNHKKIICAKISNVFYSATSRELYLHMSKPYKYLCSGRFACFVFMKLAGLMSFYCNGNNLPKHFCNSRENQGGQRAFIATCQQVCLCCVHTFGMYKSREKIVHISL